MIKYRVYDTQEKKYRDDLYFFIAPNGELLWSYELTDGLYPTDPQRFIIEQYTGLKDKNGVEIAVGDIVRAKGYSGYNNHSVVYSERFASFDIYKPDAPKMRISDIVGRPHTDDIEVIGNIHENAELLEEEK